MVTKRLADLTALRDRRSQLEADHQAALSDYYTARDALWRERGRLLGQIVAYLGTPIAQLAELLSLDHSYVNKVLAGRQQSDSMMDALELLLRSYIERLDALSETERLAERQTLTILREVADELKQAA